MDNETRTRIKAAWIRWRDVIGVLRDKRMATRLKSLVYKTVVRPVALYGTECRPTTKTTKHLLHVMEIRMLRWTLSFTRFDRIRNTKVRQEIRLTSITEKMRQYRLRWYEHVFRANISTIASIACTMNVVGR